MSHKTNINLVVVESYRTKYQPLSAHLCLIFLQANAEQGEEIKGHFLSVVEFSITTHLKLIYDLGAVPRLHTPYSDAGSWKTGYPDNASPDPRGGSDALPYIAVVKRPSILTQSTRDRSGNRDDRKQTSMTTSCAGHPPATAVAANPPPAIRPRKLAAYLQQSSQASVT